MLGSKAPNYDTYELFRATHSTILPNIRISWDYHHAFMLILGAGPKVIHPPMSKLMWV